MAKKAKGEVSLAYDGAAFTLLLDFNALADFEDEAGIPNAMEALKNIGGLGAKGTLTLFWCGLRQNHPDITRQEAGRILTENFDKLGEALLAAFPSAEIEEDEGDTGNAKPAKKARR